MKLLALLPALAFILATGLSLLRLNDWWIRAFDFPRPQVAILGILLLVAYIWVWDVRKVAEGSLLALLALSVAYQGWRILPYTPFYPKQVQRAENPDPDNSISILVSNVFMENRESQKLIERIRSRSPDLIFAVETDERWEKDLRPIEDEYPHTVKYPLSNTYGLLLYSRLPLVKPRVEFLVADDIPSVHTGVRLPSGRNVRFIGLHPRPPAPSEALDTVERDGELLIVAKRVSEDPGPSIVTGDLNDVAWSSTTSLMQRISGLMDPRIGRGLYSSFHAKIPVIRWPLDHVFHSEHFELVEMERLASIGSDHFPVFVHLTLTPEAPQEQEAPEADAGDEVRAEEKIDEALDEDPRKAGDNENGS